MRDRSMGPFALAGLGCMGVLVLLGAGAAILIVAAAANLDLNLGDGSGLTPDPGRGDRSQRLAIEVGPSEGLDDGSEVIVSSEAFDAHRVVAVAMCLREADTSSAGVEACDTVSGARYAVDPEGRLLATFPVPRVITVRGEAHDCAAAPSRCLVVAADSTDYDRSGARPVSFRAGLPPVPLQATAERTPSARLPVVADREGPYRDESRVTLTAMGFQPGEPVLVATCLEPLTTSMEDRCQPDDLSAATHAVLFRSVAEVELHADERGVVEVASTARAVVSPYAGSPGSCAGAQGGGGGCAFVVAAAADTQRSAVLPYVVAPQ